MKQISCKLLFLILALFLLPGCGKTVGLSASDTTASSDAGAMRPTEHPKDSVTENGTSTAKESEDVLPEQKTEGIAMTEMRIIVGEAAFSAELYDNEAAQTLAEMLPLTLDMRELNGNEKYYYLGETLPGESSVPDEIHTGDLMLYGSDCLVLFYKDFSTIYSYTPLGRIGNPEGLAAALGGGNVHVIFQVQAKP